MKKAYEFYQNELSAIREAGTYKDERIIVHRHPPALPHRHHPR